MSQEQLYWYDAIKRAFKGKKSISLEPTESLSRMIAEYMGEIEESCPELLNLYRSVCHFLDMEIKKGRSHLLSLCHAVRRTIDSIALELANDNKPASLLIDRMLKEHLEYFYRLPFFINFNKLRDEIELCQNIIVTTGELEIYEEMHKMELVLDFAFDLIQNDISDMAPREQLMAKMEFFLTSGKDAYFPPESLIYKKSRGIDCDEATAASYPFVKDSISAGMNENLPILSRFVHCAEVRIDTL